MRRRRKVKKQDKKGEVIWKERWQQTVRSRKVKNAHTDITPLKKKRGKITQTKDKRQRTKTHTREMSQLNSTRIKKTEVLALGVNALILPALFPSGGQRKGKGSERQMRLRSSKEMRRQENMAHDRVFIIDSFFSSCFCFVFCIFCPALHFIPVINSLYVRRSHFKFRIFFLFPILIGIIPVCYFAPFFNSPTHPTHSFQQDYKPFCSQYASPIQSDKKTQQQQQ